MSANLQSPIPLETLEASIGGVRNSRFFPPAAYTSEDFYRYEIKTVWLKEWVAVGRTEEIPQPGDYFTITIGSEPLIVVRNKDRSIHAMSAVCRHRAMILAEGSGHCKSRFVCPYHRWTYDLQGNLVGAPDMADVKTFDRKTHGLPRARTEIWNSVIFVNFDNSSPPLGPRLASLDPIVAAWRLAELKDESVVDTEAKMHFTYNWNWKIYAEGQSECYHCDKLHGDTPAMKLIDFKSMQMLVDEPDRGVFVFEMRTKTIDHTLNHTGQAVFSPIPELPEDKRWTSCTVVIAPNIFMQLMSDCVILLCWFPAGPKSMSIKRFRLYPRETLDRTDFLQQREPERAAARHFVSQDDEAFGKVQQGVESQFAPQGPISAKEPVLTGFNHWLVSRYKAGHEDIE